MNKNKNKLINSIVLLVVLIIFCAVLAHFFSGSETLSEYAVKNPEIAYHKKDAASENKDSEEPTPQSETEDTEKANPEKEKTEKESATANTESEELSMIQNTDRITYKEGFSYEPLSEELKKRITGVSYPVTPQNKETTAVPAVNIVDSAEDIAIAYDELRYVRVLYINFKGIERTGELICNQAIAQDLVEIFYELYRNEYQIEQIRLIDEYSGDDTLSMQDNNTSCFNYRVVDGTSSLSKHALGLAIDINPFFNPYVVYKEDGSTYISPQGSETYADRSKDFAYKIDENDLCYKLFKEHGFTWGGDWNSCKDYQHFQKVPE